MKLVALEARIRAAEPLSVSRSFGLTRDYFT